MVPAQEIENKVIASAKGNHLLSKQSTFLKLWKQVVLILLIFFVLSVVVNSLFWFIVSETTIPKNIRQLGFYRYFINDNYTNLGYRLFYSLIFSGDKNKSWAMIKPYPKDAYLIRGKDVGGEYTYGLLGKFRDAYTRENTVSGQKELQVIMEVETKNGKIYRFIFPEGLNAYSRKAMISSDINSLYLKELRGATLSLEEEEELNQARRSGELNENIKGMGLFYPLGTGVPSTIEIKATYQKGELILIKFSSNLELPELLSTEESERYFPLISSIPYSYQPDVKFYKH